MENKGILIGQLIDAPTAEENANKTRYNAVFNFTDLAGNTYSSLKAYGSTADELFANGKAGQSISIHYSLRVRTQQQSNTGESVFSLLIRNVGMSADPNYIQRAKDNNKMTIEGTLLEAPMFTQENGQQVAYIKLNVIKRNLSLSIEKDKNEIMVIAIRNQSDVNTLQHCSQGGRLYITGNIKPVPGSYVVMFEAQTVEVFAFKSSYPNATTNAMGMQAGATNSMINGANGMMNNANSMMNGANGMMNNANSMMNGANGMMNNTNSITNNTITDVKPNSGLLRYVNNQVIDSNNQTYDPSTIPGCSTKVINNQVFITNAQGEFINSNGEVIDENGQLKSNNVPQNQIGFVQNQQQPQNNLGFGQNQSENQISSAQNQQQSGINMQQNQLNIDSKPNSGLLRYVNNQVIDSNNQVYDPNSIPGCHTKVINNQIFITNAQGEFINSNGEVIDENGQLKSNNMPQSQIGFVQEQQQVQNNMNVQQNSFNNTMNPAQNQQQAHNMNVQQNSFNNTMNPMQNQQQGQSNMNTQQNPFGNTMNPVQNQQQAQNNMNAQQNPFANNVNQPFGSNVEQPQFNSGFGIN